MIFRQLNCNCEHEIALEGNEDGTKGAIARQLMVGEPGSVSLKIDV